MNENRIQRMKYFGIIATCITAISVLSAQTTTKSGPDGLRNLRALGSNVTLSDGNNPSVPGNTNPSRTGNNLVPTVAPAISPVPSIPNPRESITPFPSPVVTPTVTSPPR